jgi:hypothetical protein
MTDEIKRRGRPSKYRPEYAEQAEKLCRLGATDREVADFFDVDERTLNRWKRAYPPFCHALKRGKLLADAEVADKLYRRALGYSHGEEKLFLSEGSVIRVATVKHYPPDTTACIFWLKNRQPCRWRDRVTNEHNFGLRLTHEQALEQLDAEDEGGPVSAERMSEVKKALLAGIEWPKVEVEFVSAPPGSLSPDYRGRPLCED